MTAAEHRRRNTQVPHAGGADTEAAATAEAESAMSRGEMVRRLDDAASTAAAVLANGPLSPEEQRAITEALAKLLPLVADSLQDQLDAEAAAALLRGEHDRR